LLLFPASATGNVAPSAVVYSDYFQPTGVALDAKGKIYITDAANGFIVILPANPPSGTVKPLADVTSPCFSPTGDFVDVSGALYVTDDCNPFSPVGNVYVFAPNPNSSSIPVRTISGSNTRMVNPLGVAVDRVGHIYVVDGGAKAVLEYAANANGNVAPIAVLQGANTGFQYPAALTLDPSGVLYVADFNANSVFVFGAGASGNIAPTRTIHGSNTTLSSPSGVALDASGKLYVANYAFTAPPPTSIAVFAAGANGNVAPVQRISGGKARLYAPDAIAVH
jgi:sugar lactone lactonase YvrE